MYSFSFLHEDKRLLVIFCFSPQKSTRSLAAIVERILKEDDLYCDLINVIFPSYYTISDDWIREDGVIRRQFGRISSNQELAYYTFDEYGTLNLEVSWAKSDIVGLESLVINPASINVIFH